MNPNQNEGGKVCMGCGCNCHKAAPIAIILIGLVWLAGSLGWLSMGTVGIVLPILVVIAGASKLCRCKK